MKSSILEGLKEVGRILLLAIVSYLLTEGIIDAIVAYFVGTRLDAMTKTYIIGLTTTLLKSVDKWLHELGKETENTTLTRGITQF